MTVEWSGTREGVRVDVEVLRAETRAAHQAAEAALRLMSTSLTRPQCLACLTRMYAVFSEWEKTAAAKAPEWMRDAVAARNRTQLLRADLAWLGLEKLPAERPELPALTSEAEFMGSMYVMEGSTLGGQLIARHLGKVLAFDEGDGYSFFLRHEKTTGARWRDFCGLLRNSVPEEQSPSVLGAARAMFEAFRAWMQAPVSL